LVPPPGAARVLILVLRVPARVQSLVPPPGAAAPESAVAATPAARKQQKARSALNFRALRASDFHV
jgi:hypothetical protein